jgi:2-polyprenyl-6-methoxyphenol hydroxylase-like FAD-dependent oxidoreductase
MKKIAIVGAGIAGVATALSLRSSAFAIDMYEQAAEVKGIGSGLTLWPNATAVLQTLGVLDDCLARSGRLDTLHIVLSNGRPIMDIPTGDFDTPAIAMHRGELHRILLEKLNQPVHKGQRCLGVRTAAEGSYLLFADGEKGPYDLIVAADGIRSILRRQVLGDALLRPKGYRIWRGLAEAKDLFGADGRFFEVWERRLRFGVLPLGKGMVCWYAARNQAANDVRSLAAQKESLMQDFSRWDFPARELLARTDLADFIPSDVTDLKPTRGWSKDRILLIGDAIHPMPANLGLGGNMALEDGLALGRLLQSHDDIDQVCREFEEIRFARVASVMWDSNFVGFFCQTKNPLINQLRNVLCSIVPGRYFTWESRSLYSYRA